MTTSGYSPLSERYRNTLEEISLLAQDTKITLIAVSKGQPVEKIITLYEAGCRDFGESRVQEAFAKMDQTPQDIRWHLIGSLQTKKVPKVIGRFHLIHSVDSVELANKIAECSQKTEIITPILLQVNVSGELTKHGFSPENLKPAFDQLIQLPSVKIEGLMTMAPHIEDKEQIRGYFMKLRELRDELGGLTHLSMGMSQDYREAIVEGATLLRIGSFLFV